MNNQPKKPLKKKDKLARMISKLNILEKLLNQPMVSVRKALGDSELVEEVNKELKTFIQQQMDFIFNPESIQSVHPFTDQEVDALKELARNYTDSSSVVPSTLPVEPAVPPVAPETPAPVAPRPQYPPDRYGQPEDPNLVPPFVPAPAPVEPSVPVKKTPPKTPSAGKSHVQAALLESYGIDVTDPNVSMIDKATAMRKLEADNRKKEKKKE